MKNSFITALKSGKLTTTEPETTVPNAKGKRVNKIEKLEADFCLFHCPHIGSCRGWCKEQKAFAKSLKPKKLKAEVEKLKDENEDIRQHSVTHEALKLAVSKARKDVARELLQRVLEIVKEYGVEK